MLRLVVSRDVGFLLLAGGDWFLVEGRGSVGRVVCEGLKAVATLRGGLFVVGRGS